MPDILSLMLGDIGWHLIVLFSRESPCLLMQAVVLMTVQG